MCLYDWLIEVGSLADSLYSLVYVRQRERERNSVLFFSLLFFLAFLSSMSFAFCLLFPCLFSCLSIYLSMYFSFSSLLSNSREKRCLSTRFQLVLLSLLLLLLLLSVFSPYFSICIRIENIWLVITERWRMFSTPFRLFTRITQRTGLIRLCGRFLLIAFSWFLIFLLLEYFDYCVPLTSWSNVVWVYTNNTMRLVDSLHKYRYALNWMHSDYRSFTWYIAPYSFHGISVGNRDSNYRLRKKLPMGMLLLFFNW
jgi:hypothetical protein